jgi:hypothetical protein
MARIWVTNGTPTMTGILNPLTMACDRGYVPDEAWVISNPGVAESVANATDQFEVTECRSNVVKTIDEHCPVCETETVVAEDTGAIA